MVGTVIEHIALYGQSTKLHIPFSCLSDEFKVIHSREVVMYKDSADIKMTSTGIIVKTRAKWQAHEAVSRAEAWPKHKTLMGTVAMWRAGLGSFPKPCCNRARNK